MQYRILPHTDLNLSAVGLGCNNFGWLVDFEGSRRVIGRALDAGINHFDTANTYGGEGTSEKFLADVLGPRRKDVIIATKFGFPFGSDGKLAGASRQIVMQAVESSLQRLRTDYIDLCYQHRPDDSTSIEETLRALDDLVTQGKVRYIGNSNFSGRQLADADDTAKAAGLTRFVCAQDELSLIRRGVELYRAPVMIERGMSLLPYLPLASGLLTGKYRRGAPMPTGSRLAMSNHRRDRFMTAANLELVYAIADFCEWRGIEMLDVALAWLLKKPYVASVIAGAATPEQVDRNVRAAGSTVSDADIGELDEMTRKTLSTMSN